MSSSYYFYYFFINASSVLSPFVQLSTRRARSYVKKAIKSTNTLSSAFSRIFLFFRITLSLVIIRAVLAYMSQNNKNFLVTLIFFSKLIIFLFKYKLRGKTTALVFKYYLEVAL